MNIGGSASSVSVNIQTVSASLPDALRLAAEVLREPTFFARRFDQLRNVHRRRGERRQQPEALAQIASCATWIRTRRNDVRYIRSVDDRSPTQKATLDDVKRFYKISTERRDTGSSSS